MNIAVTSSAAIQSLPQVDSTAKAAPEKQTVAGSPTLNSDDQLRLQIKHDRTKNMIVGISTITGMVAGAGTMLASRSTTGMMVGMGIMGLGLMSGRIANGKDVGSGVVAYAGGAAAIGIGSAVGFVTKQPLIGGLAAGAAEMGVLALSKSLEAK